jgi:ATP-dependent Lon protease
MWTGAAAMLRSSTVMLPLVPLRDMVLFPQMEAQLYVGRESSIRALEQAKVEGLVFFTAQHDAKIVQPSFADLFPTGSIGVIRELERLGDGTLRTIIEGVRRARARRVAESDGHFVAELDELAEPTTPTNEDRSWMRRVQALFETVVKLDQRVDPTSLMRSQAMDDPVHVSFTVAANVPAMKLADRQALLEMDGARERLERLHQLLEPEVEILETQRRMRTRAEQRFEENVERDLRSEIERLRASLALLIDALAEGKTLPNDAIERIRRQLE